MARLSRNFKHLARRLCSRTLYPVLAGAILWGSTSSSWSQTATQATPARKGV